MRVMLRVEEAQERVAEPEEDGEVKVEGDSFESDVVVEFEFEGVGDEDWERNHR